MEDPCRSMEGTGKHKAAGRMIPALQDFGAGRMMEMAEPVLPEWRINMTAFLESLRVMLLGMLGIFTVTAVLTGVTRLLNRFFPAEGETED